MKGKVIVYYGQKVEFSHEVISIISFTKDIVNVGKRQIIVINKEEKYFRYYLNFKRSPEIENSLMAKYLKNREKIREEIRTISILGLKYREHKLYGKTFNEFIPFKALIKEVSLLIEAYYKYYSIACAILTTLFFTKIGIPSSLPKIIDYIYGQDFLDDFFFAPAFIFTIFESTTDLLLGERLVDEACIARSFLSFLLWKHAKPLLKIPYFNLIQTGVSRDLIWVIL
ncbi:hypothetical protein F1847_08215 [Thermodesulfobacterium sp. TA1]|uniref:hypothetical protein n=1 Tax=Thermodesulfobacterium sp. TA1 TaxID=2234087 RepID=UPI001232A9AC|nr:hypothetical protein [Thermodesulfobacterium sp. TA1]QER42727.1 hypothetical protein F1847_08215 [Thermodesulfobacterium sp. TA1]